MPKATIPTRISCLDVSEVDVLAKFISADSDANCLVKAKCDDKGRKVEVKADCRTKKDRRKLARRLQQEFRLIKKTRAFRLRGLLSGKKKY